MRASDKQQISVRHIEKYLATGNVLILNRMDICRLYNSVEISLKREIPTFAPNDLFKYELLNRTRTLLFGNIVSNTNQVKCVTLFTIAFNANVMRVICVGSRRKKILCFQQI